MTGRPRPARRFTIMVVPEGGTGEVRQLTITASRLRAWAIAGAVFVLLGMLAAVGLLTALPRSLAYSALLTENMALKARIQGMELTLDQVDDALQQLRLYQAQIDALPDASFGGDTPAPDLPIAPAPAPQEPDSAPPTPPKTNSPNLGLEGEEGAASPDASGEGVEDLTPAPANMSTGELWALSVADRLTRTAAVLTQVVPTAGLLAESAETWLSTRSSVPSTWPVEGVLTSHFGYRRSPFGRNWEFHSGIDIGAPYGSWVLAPAGGTVTKAGYDGGLGQVVEIDHGNGIMSLLGHNSELFVSIGDKVKRGEPVAAVGSTGMSTGPHCHYSVLVNGELVDPLLYLPARTPS